jgi:CheY-like chemotaxis protein
LSRTVTRVTLITDTDSALEAIDGGATFDLYILDIDITGEPSDLAVARMLEFRRQPLVIFITGDPGLAAHPEFKGRRVLAKPIDFARLRRTSRPLNAWGGRGADAHLRPGIHQLGQVQSTSPDECAANAPPELFLGRHCSTVTVVAGALVPASLKEAPAPTAGPRTILFRGPKALSTTRSIVAGSRGNGR